MRQELGPGALGRPRGIGWRGRWERGSGWGTHINPWLFHFNVWQKSTTIKKKKEKKKKKLKVAQSWLILCNPRDYTVHGILQTRILEWVAFPFSGGSSQPRSKTQFSCIAGRFFFFFFQLSHRGSPRTVEWVACPFCSISSQPRNQTTVCCIAVNSLPTKLSGKPIKSMNQVNWKWWNRRWQEWTC